MRAIIKEKIYLQTDDSPKENKAIQKIKEALTLDNPLWHKLKRMGQTKALYGVPQAFRYYEIQKESGELILPRGIINRLRDYCQRESLPLYVDDETSFPEFSDIAKSYIKSVKLRDYQYGVPEEILESKNGIVKASTGWGKTVLMLKLIEKLQCKTLVIVPRRHLADQFIKQSYELFGIAAVQIKNPQKCQQDVGCVTLQALQRWQTSELALIGRSYGLVCVDECHLTPPAKSRRIIQGFSSRYLYGFTATPRRSDGQSQAIQFLYGNILVDKKLPQEVPEVQIIPLYSKYYGFEYFEIIDAQIKDNIRNGRIAKIVDEEQQTGRRILVLTKRVEHAKELSQRIKGSICVRPKDLKKLPSATVLCGTYSLLSTGFDLPSLDTLILAGDLRSDILHEQSSGRILRLFAGKQSPKIIDIADIGHPILKNQHKERMKFYKKAGWKILI